MLCKDPRTYPTAPGGLLPCGQCHGCKFNRRRDWSTRLILETQYHAESCWLTLTYNDENLPYDRVDPRSGVHYGLPDRPTVWRGDYQNFFKRLREYVDYQPFKYFIAAEYGDKSWRPHYHACIYGLGPSLKNTFRRAWATGYSERNVQPIGNIYVGSLTWDSCQYTAGYTVKKLTSPADPRLDGRYPEFGQPSKGMALDVVDDIIAYMHQFGINSIPSELTRQGRSLPVPRYIKNKLRERLGVSKEEAQAEWKSEMYDMRLRLKNSKTVFSLEDLYEEENRQSLLNQDAKIKLFYEKEKLL